MLINNGKAIKMLIPIIKPLFGLSSEKLAWELILL